MLKILDEKLQNSSLKFKIELFLLPLFIVLLFIIILELFIKNDKASKDNVQIKQVVLFKSSYLDIINEIEYFCNKNNIIIEHSSNINKEIFLSGKSTRKQINNLLSKLESINSFSNVSSFNIQKITNQSLYNFEIKIDFKKHFIKHKIYNNTDKHDENNFYLQAIMGDYVFINSKILRKNDFIEGYKITDINQDSVEIEKIDKKIILRLHKKNEFIKYFN